MWIPHTIGTKLRRAAWLAAIVVAAVAAGVAVPHIHALVDEFSASRSVETQALEILRREPLRFLVTDRVAAQIVVGSGTNSLVLGRREGYLIAKVSLYYGVDLANLSRQSIVREGSRLVITVPDPGELDFAVDLDSLRYLSKRSGLQVAADWLLDRDQRAELRSQFREAARAYLRDQALLPGRDEIVRRLDGVAGAIGDRLGLEVVFR